VINIEELRCIGCGGVLQNEDPKAPFYTPKSLETEELVYCQRCFKMRHYNEVIPSALKPEDYQSIISTIASKDATIVKVIDLFDIDGSMMPQITKMTQKDNVIIVANKRDLLPKVVSEAKLRHKLKKILADYEIKPLDILFVSAKKKHNIDKAIHRLFDLARGKDLYVVGATNVGKSTLINAFINASTTMKKELITISETPGTTQDFIAIPFGKQTLYDTPGLFNKNHIANVLSIASYEKIMPKQEVKQRIYQLKPGQTLFLGGLFRLDFTKGEPSSFIAYFSEKIPVHRRKTEGADEFYQAQLTKLLNPPSDKDQPFTLHATPYNFKLGEKIDIVIPGLGFITLKGEGSVKIYTPKTIQPYKREALI